MNKELNRQKAPVYHQITKINIPDIECGQLTNQVPYSILSGGSQELVYLELKFNAGHTYADVLVSTFTSAMLVCGTKHHSAKQIADTFDFYGAELRADSNSDHAILSLFCMNKYLDKLLPLFCEIVEESVFPENELQIMIADKKNQFIVNHTKTSVLASDAMHKMVFGTHIYGRRAQLSDYDTINSDTLRKFYAKHYCAANSQLLVAGYVTNDVMKSIDATIGQLSAGQAVKPIIAPILPVSGDKTQIIKMGDAVQSSLRMGLATIKMDHPDYHKLHMLTMVLGGYFGSRLMTNIRKEKGYTYGIYSILFPQVQSGLLRILGDIKSGFSSQVADEVRKEMQKLKDQPISNDEMALVRNYMMGEMLQMFDGPFTSCDAVAKAIDMGVGMKYFEDEQNSILNTKPSELQEMANKYFDLDNLATAIAGNE
ncbi:MAG: insulinase family protein [Salinivirgaceae bacterium]|nr:insulinase family protein [Salinivirgaceae bacterium]